MFVELMPLLAGRTVMITVARVDDKTLRVNVIPTTISGENENPALTTPLSYTGTPEELDGELAKHLTSYVECHQKLGSLLAQAKAEMDAAAKAAQEEARKKAEERRKKAADKPAEKTAAAAVFSFGLSGFFFSSAIVILFRLYPLSLPCCGQRRPSCADLCACARWSKCVGRERANPSCGGCRGSS